MTRQPIDWDKSFKDKTSTGSSESGEGSKKGYMKSLKDILGDRLYKPKKDAQGKATKVIRFLPSALTDQVARIKVVYHEIKDPQDFNRFSNVLCDNYTHDHKNMDFCEVCKRYFKARKENDSLVLGSMKLVTRYFYNILVVNDPEEPENNGKVFLFNASKFIDDKIFNYAKPSDPTEDSEDITSYSTGRNLKYVLTPKQVPINGKKITMSDDNQSEFRDKSAIGLGKTPFTEKELDELDQKIYSLEEIISKENMPTKEQALSAIKYIYGEDEVFVPEPKKSFIESSRVTPPKNKEVDTSSIPEFPEEEYDFSSFGTSN